MSELSVDVEILASAVRELGPIFQTKDVSEQSSVRDAHPELTTHSHYHAFIGKALSLHHVQLGIVKEGEDGARGTVWRKQSR